MIHFNIFNQVAQLSLLYWLQKAEQKKQIWILCCRTLRSIFFSFSRVSSRKTRHTAGQSRRLSTQNHRRRFLHRKPSFWGTADTRIWRFPDQGSHLRVFDADADTSSTSAAGLLKSLLSESCPEAVSGIGVLRCSKTSEGHSLMMRNFGVSNAANSNISDLWAHNG